MLSCFLLHCISIPSIFLCDEVTIMGLEAGAVTLNSVSLLGAQLCTAWPDWVTESEDGRPAQVFVDETRYFVDVIVL
ncbi:hypothetical protein DFH07DRAFT_804916, partial [Mycena maculata]